jgi:hypothetical protein
VIINGRLFDVAYFKYDRDLDPWIVTEVKMAMAAKGKAPAAATDPAKPPAVATPAKK